MNKDTVSVVCTSFNRPDLLEKTLKSFFKFNKYPIEQFIVIDDSGEVGCNSHLAEQFPTVEFQYNQVRLGQIESVDKGYSQVTSRYVFHLEEDWLFYNYNFIPHSLSILKSNPSVMQVWLRANNDTNGHGHYDSPRSAWYGNNEVVYYIVKKGHAKKWHGFSFNPTLRRMGDYFQHAPYSSITTFIPKQPWVSEMEIGQYMVDRNYVAAIIKGDGYVKHIGDNRGIRQ